MKRNIIVIVAFMTLIIGSSHPAAAIVIPGYTCYTINVTPVVQARSNWCWAACAEMTGKALYSSTDRTQYDAAYYFFHNYTTDEGVYINESAEVTSYIAYNTKYLTFSYSALGFYTIQSHIQSGYPVQAALGQYSGGMRTGGHLVVVKGTAYNTATGAEQSVEYINPYNGNTYCCLYTAFCNGSYNGRIYDQSAYVSS